MTELHLQMGEEEILQEYKYATKKFDQVRILAELNCVSKKEMAQWLRDHGCEVDGRYFAEGKKVKVTEADTKLNGSEKEVGAQTTEQFINAVPAPYIIPTPTPPAQEAKADAGKERLTLVPMQIVFDIAKVREFGNAKYHDPDNWKRVEPERYREAAFRHFLKYIDDPLGVDEESGLPHRFHLECNLAFLAEMEK